MATNEQLLEWAEGHVEDPSNPDPQPQLPWFWNTHTKFHSADPCSSAAEEGLLGGPDSHPRRLHRLQVWPGPNLLRLPDLPESRLQVRTNLVRLMPWCGP